MLLCSGLPAAADDRLIGAVMARDLSAVRTLIGEGTPVNARQADGATALHWAVHRGEDLLTELLLGAGADPNAANDLGITPLWLACENRDAAAVARLLAAGAHPDGAEARARPLMMCARTGSIDAVTALLARKADVNTREPLRDQTPLMWAAARRHPDVVRVLLAHGADVHARSRYTRVVVNRANPNDIYEAVVGEVSVGGGTPLLFAVRSGDAASARLLLAAGADANDLMADGTSALTLAAHSHHLDVVRLLLEAGANPNVISSGYAALHAAVLRGNLEMVQALVARGALVDSRLRHGTPTLRGSQAYVLPESLAGATPLWLAVRFLEPAIVELLLARGASPAATLRDGTTLLMAAAGVGVQPKLFDRRDRAVLLRDSDEAPALAMVNVLLARGADVQAANNRGETALHGAAAMNYPTVVRRLIERGARRDARNRKGETPAAVATGDKVREILGGR